MRSVAARTFAVHRQTAAINAGRRHVSRQPPFRKFAGRSRSAARRRRRAVPKTQCTASVAGNIDPPALARLPRVVSPGAVSRRCTDLAATAPASRIPAVFLPTVVCPLQSLPRTGTSVESSPGFVRGQSFCYNRLRCRPSRISPSPILFFLRQLCFSNSAGTSDVFFFFV